jgi:two-component system chemotaxis sensor kinase CheA
MDAILEQFLTEARDNLEYLDKNLESIKDSDEETINALFRAAHTLKGGAGLVGFNAVKEVTHAAEDLLDAYRNKKIEFNDEMIDILYDAFDEVVELIDAAEELGSVDVEIDQERIDELKNKIRAFISHDTPKEDIQIDINIDENLTTEDFTILQIQKLAKKLPIKAPKITKEFLENENWYFIVLDLDVDTIELGNDPIYLFSLLESDFEVAIKVNCPQEPLEWGSLISAFVKSTQEKLVDSFYNIIDDIQARTAGIDILFDNEYDNNEMFEDFKSEIIDIIKNEDYHKLDEKLSAITQILNTQSYEGFILVRLQAILSVFDINSNEYKEILDIALDKLGIKLTKQEVEPTSQVSTPSQPPQNQENQDILKDLLKAQLDILKLAKDDVVYDRTWLIVQNVAHELNTNIEATNIEELKTAIKSLLEMLGEKIEEPKPEPKTKLQPPKKEKKATPKTIKIDQNQIDELMDVVGELLVVKNALPYIAENLTPKNVEESKRELSSKYEEISRIIDQLRDRVMQMRLLPLEYIFGRYPKLVRDISKKLGKKIKYIEKGGDTKLDKMVIEKLADPLVHIIRNSLDHGIETPQERLAKQKPEEGTLEISATSQGDKVFIVIKDDGRGIDINKVINKALEKRLISSDVLDKMSEEEKLKLVFLPGLSTKEEITELSGRGVGTDAVKKTIEELGGKIYIKSIKDVGTEIKLELPLSVALTNVFHIEMNNINYAIPMDYIVETVKILDSDIQTANHKPFIKIRGELIPLLVEEELLGYNRLEGEISIVVIKFNDIKVGFVVDEFVGQLDVVQKPLTGVISYHPFISGISLLGNGDILFILDVTKILKNLE